MPSLKSIRKRIVSVRNTQKITKAMKMVAAAKLRRAQDGVVAMRPYANRMKGVVADLMTRLGDDLDLDADATTEASTIEAGGATGAGLAGPAVPGQPDGAEGAESVRREASRMVRAGEEKKIRVLAVTSDRGLAGAFNSNINRRTERFFVEREGAAVTVSVVGKKGRDYLKRRKATIKAEFAGVDPKTVQARAQEIAAHLADEIMSGEVDAVYVIYNEFKNAGTQIVRVERLLPLRAPEAALPPGQTAPDEARLLTDFVYEPSQKEVLRHLLPLQLETEIARVLLESIASEMGARMSAMDNASRNAKEMIGRLTLQYNRARQAAITKELMEIVSGAEALKG